ncbi:hypothetical protein FI206_02625 [Salmonella enterica subsp. enterica]|nr:hypothetical protein [Salmonella enterica subsp. enterica serovar Hessarek]
MDVKFPSGLIVNNVPDGYSQAELLDQLHKAGYTNEQLGLSNETEEAKKIQSELDIAHAAIAPQSVHSNNPYVQGIIDTNTALDKGITPPSEKHDVSPLLYSLIGTRDTAGKDNIFGYLSPYTKDTKLTPDDIKDIKDITGAGKFGLDAAAFAVPEAAAGEFLGGAIGADAVANAPKAVKAAAATTRFLLPKTIGSLSAQSSHDNITAKQTGIDLAFTGIADLIFGGIGSATEGQVKDALNKLLESGGDSPELREVTRQYLAHSRLQELGEHLQALREVNSAAILDDAIAAMKEEVPDVFEGQSWEDLKEAIDDGGFNEDPSSVIVDSAKSNKNEYLAKARVLAKNEQERKAIRVLAEANETYRKTLLGKLGILPMNVSDKIMPRTFTQKFSGVFSDWAGVKHLPFIESKLMEKNALNVTEAERKALIKDLRADNRRINKEIEQDAGKQGVSLNKKRFALNRQRKLNSDIIDYLQSDMKGRAKKIQPVQIAIKEAQEGDFNTPKYENLMKRFSDLQSRYENLNLSKEEKELSWLDKGLRDVGASKKVIVLYLLSKIGFTVGAGQILALSTVAEKLSQSQRSKVLSEAYNLALRVEKGEITQDEAVTLIRERMKKAKQLTRVADSGIRLFNNQNKDDKK